MKLCRQKPRLGIPGEAVNLKCLKISYMFLEIREITLGQLGRHYFSHFQEMRRKACRTKQIRNGAQKKVPESAGLVGVSGPLVGGSGQSLAQT